jgi:site-specific recombinase XerD
MNMIPYQDSPSMLPVDTTDEMLIDMWLDSKRSANTRDAYVRDVNAFLAYVQKPLQAVNLRDVQQYQLSLQGKPATITRKMAVVKSLMSFGSKMKYLAFNVGAAVQLENADTGLAQRILPEESMIKMIALERDVRNHALLRLLYHCGLRVSEIIALEWKDCVARDTGGQISVIGKRNKERVIVVEAGMWRELMALKMHATGAECFTSRNAGKLSRGQVCNIVRAAAIRAGIDANVSPHWYRHANASHSLDRGAPISLVQATLGHESLKTTGRYTHARPNESTGRYLAM